MGRSLLEDYSYLKGLSLGKTACQMEPFFQPDITKYRCKFWWNNTRSPEIIPIVDSECKGCILMMPSLEESSKPYLDMNYSDVKRRPWKSGKSWSRKFAYGEYGTVPIHVISSSNLTRTYEVYLERDAPWWMKARFAQQLSNWATAAALIMAVTSASNFMALTSQIQLLDFLACR